MKNWLHLAAERLLLILGGALLLFVCTALVHRSVYSQLALAEFDEVLAAESPKAEEDVDTSLWSAKRVREYHESLVLKKEAPLGVLKLERLKIRVPVFEGTDDLVLNRGVGWIAGTAKPGEAGSGNIGIAGHRDGFFRAFKDISIGDRVELATPGMVSVYTVDSTEIVSPDNVGVLNPREAASLTLVTCYPFYFVGDAPQRFIVHATLKQQSGVAISQDLGSASARAGKN